MKSPLEISKRAYSEILKNSKIEDLAIDNSKKMDLLIESFNSVSCTFGDLLKRQEELSHKNDRIEKINKLYFESIFKGDKEDDLTMRKRFFQKMPSATGDSRLLQLGGAKLLSEFDSLCKTHNLTYWISCGTLLGAVRHGGFIPWDDDVDISMMRNDIKKLRRILSKSKTHRLCLNYDWHVKCKQFRFRTTNDDNPCFVDVFIHDFCDIAVEEESWHRRFKEKNKISKQMDEDSASVIKYWQEHPILSENDHRAPEVAALFDKYLPEPEQKGEQIIWSFDNVMGLDSTILVFNKSEILPTSTIVFQNKEYLAPRDIETYLRRQYGDIYEIPDDLVLYFKHYNSKLKESEKNAINAYLDK